jgi:hypothetical protein
LFEYFAFSPSPSSAPPLPAPFVCLGALLACSTVVVDFLLTQSKNFQAPLEPQHASSLMLARPLQALILFDFRLYEFLKNITAFLTIKARHR